MHDLVFLRERKPLLGNPAGGRSAALRNREWPTGAFSTLLGGMEWYKILQIPNEFQINKRNRVNTRSFLTRTDSAVISRFVALITTTVEGTRVVLADTVQTSICTVAFVNV